MPLAPPITAIQQSAVGIYGLPLGGAAGAMQLLTAAQIRAIAGAGTSSFDGAYSSLSGIPSTFAPSAHNHLASEINSGTLATARLGSGAANSTTFLRGDQTWQTIDLSGYQPLDSDLTAIAALSTTSYGRSLLALADAVALRTAGGGIYTSAQTDSAIANAVTGLLDDKGPLDCSANPNYPSALKGDCYHVTVAGKIGGASGVSVEVGDVVACQTDNAGGTQASVGSSWYVLEHNLVGALLNGNNLSDIANVQTARVNLGLGVSDSPTFSVVNQSGTGAMTVPAGTTGQRPTGATSMIRWNTTTGRHEFWTGSGWDNHARLSSDQMTAATATASGTGGLVAAPAAGDNLSLWAGDATFRSCLPKLGYGTSATYYDGNGNDVSINAGLLPPWSKFSSSNVQGASLRTHFIPYHVERPFTCTKIRYYVNANVTALPAKIGFYTADRTTGLPKTLIGTVETIALDTIAFFEVTLASAKSIPAGWFWLGITPQAAVNMMVIDCQIATQQLTSIANAGSSNIAGTGSGVIGIESSYAASLPSTISPNTNLRMNAASGGYFGGAAPWIVLK